MMRLSVRRTRDETVCILAWQLPRVAAMTDTFFKALNEIKASLGWRVVVRELEMIRVEMVTYQLGLASHALHKVITESFLNWILLANLIKFSLEYKDRVFTIMSRDSNQQFMSVPEIRFVGPHAVVYREQHSASTRFK
ncbi:hypothetical protein Tco_0769283, partial [Tanacetum coccineum]